MWLADQIKKGNCRDWVPRESTGKIEEMCESFDRKAFKGEPTLFSVKKSGKNEFLIQVSEGNESFIYPVVGLFFVVECDTLPEKRGCVVSRFYKAR